MKRKGFTLVELLIVIVILGVLAASMSLSSGKAVGSAKATAIMNNMASARQAGLLYYSAHMYDVPADDVEFNDDVLKDEYIDIDNFSSTNTKYKAYVKDKGLKNADKWAIYCDFSGEPDRDDIASILNGTPTYKPCELVEEGADGKKTYYYTFLLYVLKGTADYEVYPN